MVNFVIFRKNFLLLFDNQNCMPTGIRLSIRTVARQTKRLLLTNGRENWQSDGTKSFGTSEKGLREERASSIKFVEAKYWKQKRRHDHRTIRFVDFSLCKKTYIYNYIHIFFIVYVYIFSFILINTRPNLRTKRRMKRRE